MGRRSVTTSESPSNDATSAFHSISDRFPFKRTNHNSTTAAAAELLPRSFKKTPSFSGKISRSHHHKRKLSFFTFIRGKSCFYICIFLVIFMFAFASMLLQSSIISGDSTDRMRWRWSAREGLKTGSSLQFVPRRRIELNNGSSPLDWLRSQPRIGIRPPRIGLIIGNMKKDPSTLMLYSVMKNLKELGYLLKIYALGEGRARSVWQEIGAQVSILSPERYGFIDWSIFEGIVVDSLEAKDAISRSLSALSH